MRQRHSDYHDHKWLFQTLELLIDMFREPMAMHLQGSLLKNYKIHIQRSFNNQKMYDVKTKTSNRRIDLGPSMMADLKRWKLACMPNKLNLIFPNAAGLPMNHNNMTARHFFPALERAGVERIRFHNMRHTKVSLMIDQGENIKYIQSQMGHSSPTVTLNVYAHLMKSVNQESAKRFESAILNI